MGFRTGRTISKEKAIQIIMEEIYAMDDDSLESLLNEVTDRSGSKYYFSNFSIGYSSECRDDEDY